MNGRGSRRDRERFPDLKADIGEDPARFLDYPVLSSKSEVGSPLLLARARIRGIDNLATLRAWMAIERRLDRGPRAKVLNWLDERERELEAIGERPERNEYRDGRDIPEKEVRFLDEDGEIRDRSSATSKISELAATDGGVDS